MKLNNWDVLTSEKEVETRLKPTTLTVDSFHLPPSLIRVIRIGSISVGTVERRDLKP